MSAPARKSAVFSIPAGIPFLQTFVSALLGGRLIPGFPDVADPLALADARIFVPSRRAARALTEEIARQQGGRAALLPQILPLGALGDEPDASLFEPGLAGMLSASDVPEAIDDLDRRLLLSDLILKWGEKIRHAIVRVEPGGIIVEDEAESFAVLRSPGQAFQLARELAALIDEMTIEDVSWRALETLAPDDYDKYWAITLEFLRIVAEHWPKYLREQGLIDPAQRRVLLAQAEAQRLEHLKPSQPMIVAGSTGTNAATARLMQAVSRLPNGAVVLPGLDRALDADSWRLLTSDSAAGERRQADGSAAGHHQAALARLLARLGLERADVEDIVASEVGGVTDRQARIAFVGEALRPAATAHAWTEYRQKTDAATLDEALSGIAYVDADNERLEALAIAIAMRETLEHPGRTAALVTPDRNLARRVQADLARWNIVVDDSGGDRLYQQPAGMLAASIVQLAQTPDDCVTAIGLLTQRDVRLGYDEPEMRRLARLAEIAVLRGVQFSFDSIEASLAEARRLAGDAHAHPAIREISDADWQAIAELLNRIADALAPLLVVPRSRSLQEWFAAHRQCFDAFAPAPDATAPRDDLQELEDVFDRFASARETGMRISLNEYADLFETIARETPVRGPQTNHPRLKILGLLEARLIPADVKILAGLDEHVWPPSVETGPFLNRPMRATLGLSAPERRIGQTAHDFVEALGAGQAIVTRSKKRGDSPAIPSRFVQRMAALAGPAWRACIARGDRLLDYARRLDASAAPKSVSRPEPKPSLDIRPDSMSVTAVETWRRDPYAVYAQRILRLQRLESPGREFTPADTGSALHAAIDAYHRTASTGETVDEARLRLEEIARREFADRLQDAGFLHFQWPRILASLQAFADWDAKRRGDIAQLMTEASGRWTFPLADGSSFMLTARADRIEVRKDGSVAIVDYKSGRPPSTGELNAGFAPQMTLEAAIVENGGFASIPERAAVVEATYLKLLAANGVDAIVLGERKNEKSLDQLKQEHLAGLRDLANQFRNFETPYIPRPFPQFEKRYNDYDHLARVKEWQAGSDGDAE